MMQQCGAVSAILLLVALLSRLVSETSESALQTRGRELLEQALSWRDAADGAAENIWRYRHEVMALALLQAARSCATDVELERSSGIDVNKLWSGLERRLEHTHQSVAPNTKKKGG